MGEAGAHETDGGGRLWGGRAIVLATVLAAVAALELQGPGLSGEELAASWQVLDLRTLDHDPVGSLWHLHVQPPLHNAVVALAVGTAAPAVGTLFVLYAATLAATGLLLHGLLVRRGLGPVAAGAVAAVAMANPGLLATVHVASYEVPAAALVVGSLWAAHRYLDDPRGRWLLATSGLVTAAALTRVLLHPVWVVGVLVVLAAARPVGRRAVIGALAVPLVLVGGWALKNQVVFGQATLSSWSGFNLQRGVVAPMARDQVEDAVADGAVSPLALEYPWRTLGAYAEPCAPRHDHPAVADAEKDPVDGTPIANFNHECYLPLYRQARDDAVTLARRHPGRYLATRPAALALSHRVPRPEQRTWTDRLYDPLLATVPVSVPMDDWNLPLLSGDPDLDLDVSLTLAAATAFVLGRGGLAAVRLAPRPRRWPAPEVVWLLAAWTVAVVVLGGDLVELGENNRFRTTVDPLLVALPLASLAASRGRGIRRRLVHRGRVPLA